MVFGTSTDRRLAATALCLLSSLHIASANPIFDRGSKGFSFFNLVPRQSCAIPCGWQGQLCCNTGEYCYTDQNNQAQCGKLAATAAITAAPQAAGYWSTWTTTYVRTDLVTITSLASSYVAQAQPTAAQCNYKLNEKPCGQICCTSSQYCVANGKCGDAAVPGGSSGIYQSSFMASGTTVGYLPPLRPTDSTLVTQTTIFGATASPTATGPTTTVPFLAPVVTGANVTLAGDNGSLEVTSGGGGLSGGAIAGIVIGVLLGLALLFLICFCCCIKGIFDGILAIFGLGKKKRREREYVQEDEYVYRHQSGRGSRRDDRSHYSSRPARIERRSEKKSGFGKELLGIGAGLGGLAALLGLKRQRDRRRDEKSYYSGGSRVTDITSSSSESSVREPPRARSRSRYGGTVRSASRR